MDKHSYKGWLNSDSFLKRSFGVFFYYSFASIIISSILFALMFTILIATGLLGSYFEALDKINKLNQLESQSPKFEENFNDQKYR